MKKSQKVYKGKVLPTDEQMHQMMADMAFEYIRLHLKDMKKSKKQ